MPRESPNPPERGRKARLFCQDCSHASPLDGDWLCVETAGGDVVYRCPECGRAIERRPAFGGETGRPVTACD